MTVLLSLAEIKIAFELLNTFSAFDKYMYVV